MKTGGETRIRITAADETKSAFASAQAGIDRVQQRLAPLMAGFAALGGAGISASVALEKFHHSVELLDKLDDLQEKTGVSVEKLSELRYAGETTGTTFEQLQSGLNKLAKVMAEAAGGNTEAAATFEALGVDVVDSNGKLRAADAVLSDVATRFSNFEDGPAKAALAMRLFGKSGADMIPLLNQGAAGIARAGDEARKLGAIYDKETAKAAADLNDNLMRLKLASEATAVAISGPLVKALASFTDEMVRAKKEGDSLAQLRLFVEGAGIAAQLATPAGAAALLTSYLVRSGEAATKSTAQIQAYVNAIGGLNAGAGRGFVNPKIAAPVVAGEEKPATPRAFKDPLADAKRYLEHLQKQQEQLQHLSTEEQALRDIEMDRLGQVTPGLKEQILAAARVVDAMKADEEAVRAAEKAAEEYKRATEKMREEAERLTDSVATPFEHLQTTLERITEAAERNPFLNGETVTRLKAKAWREYFEAIDTGVKKVGALETYFERISDTSGQMEETFVNAFQGMEDALVKFVQTGKLDFHSLATSIEADITRMIIRAQFTKPLYEWLFGSGSGSGGSNPLAQLMGRLFGNGGGAGQGVWGGSPDYGALSTIGNMGADFIIPGLDVGTNYVPRDMLAMVHEGEAVVPKEYNPAAGGSGGGVTVNVHQSFAPGTDRRTVMQAAAAAGEQARRALSRNR